MRNILFQFVWFAIVRPFINRKTGDGSQLSHYARRMVWQVRLALLFGEIQFLILGDSNAEGFANLRMMSGLGKLSVNIGIGGTRADQWEEFFRKTDEGREILVTIKRDHPRQSMVPVLVNVGGNAVLQRKMESAKAGLEYLKKVFPYCWATTVPPIYASVLEGLASLTREQIREDVRILNKWIKEIWGPAHLDVYSALLDPSTGEAIPGALQDPVHFSSRVRFSLVRLLRVII